VRDRVEHTAQEAIPFHFESLKELQDGIHKVLAESMRLKKTKEKEIIPLISYGVADRGVGNFYPANRSLEI
jgi:hypothetical protein